MVKRRVPAAASTCDSKKIISLFQSDVMHLSDDATKLKLFMDVLDGTKAAVRKQHFS